MIIGHLYMEIKPHMQLLGYAMERKVKSTVAPKAAMVTNIRRAAADSCAEILPRVASEKNRKQRPKSI